VARPVYQFADPIEPDHVTLVLSGSQAINALSNDGDRMFLQRFLAPRS
jgi:8-oxo-dGTP diphosphatase